jgi:hypothetical protein
MPLRQYRPGSPSSRHPAAFQAGCYGLKLQGMYQRSWAPDRAKFWRTKENLSLADYTIDTDETDVGKGAHRVTAK